MERVNASLDSLDGGISHAEHGDGYTRNVVIDDNGYRSSTVVTNVGVSAHTENGSDLVTWPGEPAGDIPATTSVDTNARTTDDGISSTVRTSDLESSSRITFEANSNTDGTTISTTRVLDDDAGTVTSTTVTVAADGTIAVNGTNSDGSNYTSTFGHDGTPSIPGVTPPVTIDNVTTVTDGNGTTVVITNEGSGQTSIQTTSPDGSTTITYGEADDGSINSGAQFGDGTGTHAVMGSDGSTATTVTHEDGSTTITTTDSDGNTRTTDYTPPTTPDDNSEATSTANAADGDGGVRQDFAADWNNHGSGVGDGEGLDNGDFGQAPVINPAETVAALPAAIPVGSVDGNTSGVDIPMIDPSGAVAASSDTSDWAGPQAADTANATDRSMPSSEIDALFSPDIAGPLLAHELVTDNDAGTDTNGASALADQDTGDGQGAAPVQDVGLNATFVEGGFEFGNSESTGDFDV